MRDRKSDAHRQVAARKLGRPIKPGHDIDHLNSDKGDNSPANLGELSHSAHSRLSQTPGRKSLAALQKSLTMVRDRRKSY